MGIAIREIEYGKDFLVPLLSKKAQDVVRFGVVDPDKIARS
jgi:hypothetical protein